MAAATVAAPPGAPARPLSTRLLRPLARLGIAIVACAVIFFAAPLLFGQLLMIPAVAALPPPAIEGVVSLIAYGLLAAVAAAGLRVARERPRWGTAAPRRAAAGIAIGAGGLCLALGLSALAGVARLGVPGATGAVWLLPGALLTLVGAGAEEYYFRGWLQPGLQAAWGEPAGVAVAALAFAALHFVSAAAAPLSLVTLVLGGLLFGLLAARSGGLALPIAAHFGWNVSEIIVFGAQPNPGTGNYGALLNVDLIGAPWWGGSDEGLNASLSAAVVLAALVAAVATWPRGSAPGRGRAWTVASSRRRPPAPDRRG